MQAKIIGTFSVVQKNAILEELELRRKERPELEPLFSDNKDEHFFEIAQNSERAKDIASGAVVKARESSRSVYDQVRGEAVVGAPARRPGGGQQGGAGGRRPGPGGQPGAVRWSGPDW